jgi:putative nucleotidyltransferase with HDIG domain
MARLAAEQDLLPVYLVGGFVRNALLKGPEALDIDLVSADPASLGAALQRAVDGRLIRFAEGVHRVVFSWEGERRQIDIAPLRGASIVEDLRCRDFTINALGISLGEDPTDLIDPTGGLRDLRARQIRVGDPGVLAEDPLRLLRSVRLAAQLDFAIDETTAQAIRRNAPSLARVAPERLREEFFGILDCAIAGRWLTALDDLALLAVLIPETRGMRGCVQGPPHRFDVFTHSLETVRSLDRILHRLPKLFPRQVAVLIGPLEAEVEGGVSRQALLRFAALLHDVGKPDTRSIQEGRIRFLGHGERGATMMEEICRRLRLGSRALAMAVALVREHLRPFFLEQAKTITPRARYRFWRDLGPLAADCLLLSLADIRGTYGREGRAFRARLRFVQEMFAFQRERVRGGRQAGRRTPLLDGHELMAQLDLTPGPFVGFLLERLQEEAALGALRTKEAAVRYLRRHLHALREEFARGEAS